MRLPGSNGNRVLISRITTPNTLHAEYTKWGGGRKRGNEKKRRTRPEEEGVKEEEEEEEEEKTKQLKRRLVKTIAARLVVRWGYGYMPGEDSFIVTPGGPQVEPAIVSGVIPPRGLVWGGGEETEGPQHDEESADLTAPPRLSSRGRHRQWQAWPEAGGTGNYVGLHARERAPTD